MLYAGYNILLFFLLLILAPILLYKMYQGKYRQGLKQRFGFLPRRVVEKFKDRPTIWVHSVSVGETVAASSVVKRLRQEKPEYKILFSTVTDTGQKMAHKIIEADEIIYFPLDFSWCVNRVLDDINPRLIILTETELWPNFIRLARQKGIKTMLINGRISDSSAGKYKYLGPLLQDMLDNIDLLSMQSRQDEEYILKLGADPSKVYNTGNTKYDQDYGAIDEKNRDKLYAELKIDRERPVLVAGSTHEDEEKQLLEVYKRLKEDFRNLIMVLAPRDIQRSEGIADYYQKQGIDTVYYTAIEDREYDEDRVIIIDVIGKLAHIYAIADLVFIGGSLAEIGGHNMMEAAVHGKATFFGPNMFNFRDSTRLVLNYNAGIQVEDSQHLYKEMHYYLKYREQLEDLGENAINMIKVNKGATGRNIKLAEKLLSG